MTTVFIIFMFVVFILFDIIVLLGGKRTITSVMRKWYKTMPLVPFIFGVLFIGHFGLANLWPVLIPKTLSIVVFILFSLTYCIWVIVNRVDDINGHPEGKFWALNKKIFLIPMALGSLAGWFWC